MKLIHTFGNWWIRRANVQQLYNNYSPGLCPIENNMLEQFLGEDINLLESQLHAWVTYGDKKAHLIFYCLWYDRQVVCHSTATTKVRFFPALTSQHQFVSSLTGMACTVVIFTSTDATNWTMAMSDESKILSEVVQKRKEKKRVRDLRLVCFTFTSLWRWWHHLADRNGEGQVVQPHYLPGNQKKQELCF